MQKEMREKKKADKFKKYVPGANSGTDAVEVMDQTFGGNATNLLLNDKKVTERDKVGFDLNSKIYEKTSIKIENLGLI